MTTIAPERTEAPQRSTGEGSPYLEPGDHEKMSHYVDKNQLTESVLTGNPVMALCGKLWLPTRDGEKFPLCPMCEELLEMGPEGRVEFFKRREAERSAE